MTDWKNVTDAIDEYVASLGERSVLPGLSRDEVRALVASFDFARPMTENDAIARVLEGLRGGQVHTPHPRYFGLFNPATTMTSVAADALVAAFNPQLATHNHAPFAVECEAHLVRAFGERFGYSKDDADGTFACGGAEANHTAIAVAIARAFPEVAERGLRALDADPVIYVSGEAHHSLEKGARAAGLGTKAVRRVAVDRSLRMRMPALKEAIAKDRAARLRPFLVVATCGTTSAGAIDPLSEIADVAAKEKLWMHVDAAWGGFAALVPGLRDAVRGIERSDSITFDAHKSLSVPMGAGMFLTRHKGALSQAFGVHADYMPKDQSRDPYASSLQWSRRFIGLKVLLPLSVLGWEGIEQTLARFVALGARLKEKLSANGFVLKNDTPLPIACFVDGAREDGASGKYLDSAARDLAKNARAWISMTRIGPNGERVLRACITSFHTTESDVDALVDGLVAARARI
jgi:glutamate/tyrosine decarboxylase-like PLP-dependent enzyme